MSSLNENLEKGVKATKPAVFLDRDGTIIEDCHYTREPERVRLLPGAVDGLKRMRELGYHLVLISNQSGVGRGIITREQFEAVHDRFVSLLEAEGVRLDEVAYCLHAPEAGCACRKPETGLIPAGYREVASQSYVVGDKKSDIELAKNLGARGILISGVGVRDLREAAALIDAAHST